MLTWKFDVLQQNPISRNPGSIHSFVITNYNKTTVFKNFISFMILTVTKTNTSCYCELANVNMYMYTYVLYDVHKPDDGQ